jgi:hypothetical protein
MLEEHYVESSEDVSKWTAILTNSEGLITIWAKDYPNEKNKLGRTEDHIRPPVGDADDFSPRTAFSK